jgi:CheY-like chemotaxis protein
VIDDQPSAAEMRSINGVRVLVVEDETDSRDLLVEMLSDWGAHVFAVDSCEEALLALRAARPDNLPDVIVSDLGMQQQDGYDLIRQVRALTPERGGSCGR